MGTLHKAAERSALTPGRPVCVQVAGRAIALFDLGGAGRVPGRRRRVHARRREPLRR
jgi:hypothetical protein